LAQAVLVLDVGKTHAKLTLVGLDGALIAARGRANAVRFADGRQVLDADGILAWLIATASELAPLAEVMAIVPVAHGATAALVSGDALAAPVLDYEQAIPDAVAAAYDLERDPFGQTYSPRLPDGLNLGRQLFWQEQLYSDLWPRNATVLPWPQYWAWRLCGEVASEVSSLGCHTDLWRPFAGEFSDLARRRGWAESFGPARLAGETLGTIRPELATRTGLPANCAVLCGVHDNNASLWAVRGTPSLTDTVFSLVSTGTWFVAFQVGGEGRRELDPARDTLVNLGVDSAPIPSARFMGGREYALIVGGDFAASGTMADAENLVKRSVMTSPSFVPGCGPFPNSHGEVIGAPATTGERAALASLHLALMTSASLDLIGASGPVVIEGRFAEDAVYAAAMAALHPALPVLLWPGGDGAALGAARLWSPDLTTGPAPTQARPVPFDLTDYADRWLARAVEIGRRYVAWSKLRVFD
jgi:sugar (pentulose or hexulose) kinase